MQPSHPRVRESSPGWSTELGFHQNKNDFSLAIKYTGIIGGLLGGMASSIGFHEEVAHNCGIRHVGGNMVSASIFCWTWRLAHAQFHLNFRNCHSSAYHKYWAPWHICLHGIHLLACKSGHYWSVRGRNILLRGLRAVGGGGGAKRSRGGGQTVRPNSDVKFSLIFL